VLFAVIVQDHLRAYFGIIITNFKLLLPNNTDCSRIIKIFLQLSSFVSRPQWLIGRETLGSLPSRLQVEDSLSTLFPCSCQRVPSTGPPGISRNVGHSLWFQYSLSGEKMFFNSSMWTATRLFDSLTSHNTGRWKSLPETISTSCIHIRLGWNTVHKLLQDKDTK